MTEPATAATPTRPATRAENEALFRTGRPVWSSTRDGGGMFDVRLEVFADTNPALLPFLAVFTDGWGARRVARRRTQEAAVAYAEQMYDEFTG